MNIKEVLEVYDTLGDACKALGIAKQNAIKWKNKGYIPYLQQYRLCEITNGKLKPDASDPIGSRRKNLKDA